MEVSFITPNPLQTQRLAIQHGTATEIFQLGLHFKLLSELIERSLCQSPVRKGTQRVKNPFRPSAESICGIRNSASDLTQQLQVAFRSHFSTPSQAPHVARGRASSS